MTGRPSWSGTLQEYLADELRRAILRGEFRAGEPVRQEAVAERWQVSQAPVREAFRNLQAEGLLQYRPRRGYTISRLSAVDVREIFDIRTSLETSMLRDLPQVPESTLEQITRLSEEFAHAAHSLDVIAMTYSNRQAHFALFECAGKPRTLAIVRSLWEATDPYRTEYYATLPATEILAFHRSMVDLARVGDNDGLIELYEEYRTSTVQRLTSIISESEGNGAVRESPKEAPPCKPTK